VDEGNTLSDAPWHSWQQQQQTLNYFSTTCRRKLQGNTGFIGNLLLRPWLD
jgi:hypothetical protein